MSYKLGMSEGSFGVSDHYDIIRWFGKIVTSGFRDKQVFTIGYYYLEFTHTIINHNLAFSNWQFSG